MCFPGEAMFAFKHSSRREKQTTFVAIGTLRVNFSYAGICITFCYLWIFIINKLFHKIYQEYHQYIKQF